MEAAQLLINWFPPNPQNENLQQGKKMAETKDRSLAKMDLWPGCGMAWRDPKKRLKGQMVSAYDLLPSTLLGRCV